MGHIANKVDAKDKKLIEMFVERRYKVDSFQREYRWRRKQVETMISDLSASFMKDYEDGNTIADARRYDCYYMGPIVLCDDGDSLSIIDGQQRLTSLTLLFIYLMHIQDRLKLTGNLYRDFAKYLKVQGAGRDSYVLDVPKRRGVMRHLMKNGDTLHYEYAENEDRDESIVNLLGRYEDIENLFPEKLKEAKVLPIFIEWLLFRVVVVEITAYSMDSAYTIFETMNDRGLSLNPTEILKAFVLSKMGSDELSDEMNDFWKQRISQIKYKAGYEGDLIFFRSWFRAKYADSKRQKIQGAENEDFEAVGSQFHTWFKNNLKKIGLKQPSDFYYFVKSDMDFYSNVFLKIFDYRTDASGENDLFYVMTYYPMADSLYLPILMAPVSKIDNESEIDEKLSIINKYIDSYINIRTLAHKTITQSTIRDGMYEMIKDVREKDVASLQNIIFSKIQSLYDLLEKNNHMVSSYSGSYMHYFFARMIYRRDDIDDFKDLLRSRKKDSYVICRIFEEDSVEEGLREEMSIYVDCLANYCLVRRQDAKSLSIDMEHRLQELSEYLPEMVDCQVAQPIDFLKIRNEKLMGFAYSEWLGNR